ncbi:prenyltransferase/squalene oxidase repeat-containing protein [Actinomadura sp. 9N215]|uniref:prenyltransferase/squalene oxidase repeat-containing protein n=1 Tax=Actinomadura sp. 9N215 TaxID=3375150 RepID=UPI0037A69DBD
MTDPTTIADPQRALGDVLAESLADPWGRISPADHDTGLLVRAWARAPGLFPPELGQGALGALLRRQNPSGSWGPAAAPVPYHFVPTLGALCGLLAVDAARPRLGSPAGVRDAVHRGLRFLADHADELGAPDGPDTVAVEYLLPALLEDIGAHIGSPGEATAPGPDGRSPVLPRSVADRLLDAMRPERQRLADLRARAGAGGSLPGQLAFSLEVLTRPPAGHPAFGEGGGPVGCSPAATCAVLSWRAHADPAGAVRYLTGMQARQPGGAMPAIAPMAAMERSWTVAGLARLDHPVPGDLARALVRYFSRALARGAAPLGPGLPPDADVTANMLLALAHLRRPADPAPLDPFEQATRYAAYRGERTASASVNAHVLEALGAWSAARAGRPPHSGTAKARDWLLDTQSPDGTWDDKWHASPYYASCAAAMALGRHGGRSSRAAVDRTERWVLATQRPDGSFGIWCPTLDETAHAAQFLLARHGRPVPDDRSPPAQAVRAAAGFLARNQDAAPGHPVRTPLWHGKELYEPERLVRSLVLAVLAACPAPAEAA